MLFIDTSTGTWGQAEDIVLLSPEAEDAFLRESEFMSDSQVIDFGDQKGKRLPFTLIHQY